MARYAEDTTAGMAKTDPAFLSAGVRAFPHLSLSLSLVLALALFPCTPEVLVVYFLSLSPRSLTSTALFFLLFSFGCCSGEGDRTVRRQMANNNERRRMQHINKGFDSLRALLPISTSQERMSKVSHPRPTTQKQL